MYFSLLAEVELISRVYAMFFSKGGVPCKLIRVALSFLFTLLESRLSIN